MPKRKKLEENLNSRNKNLNLGDKVESLSSGKDVVISPAGNIKGVLYRGAETSGRTRTEFLPQLGYVLIDEYTGEIVGESKEGYVHRSF